MWAHEIVPIFDGTNWPYRLNGHVPIAVLNSPVKLSAAFDDTEKDKKTNAKT